MPVRISTGLVQGVPSELPNITVYKGLRYAASTGGANRWRAPQPPASWEGVKVADTFGPPCPQVAFGAVDLVVEPSEDCLSLNVWTPVDVEKTDVASAEKLPVFVWIYGGRFIAGSGSERAYDGAGLASKGIVVVTLNYRVGILGFLATPELSAESGHNSSGNYGILDQNAALKWVQENIAAFGGDPAKVTVGGQSAGGASTGLHILSPLSRGLFRAAIPQSGWRYPRDPLLSGLAPAYRTKEVAERQGAETVREKGAATLEELRAMPLDKLLEGNNKNDDRWGNPPFYRPCIDGYVIPLNYNESLQEGIQADVPIMTGHNADEGGTYTDPAFDENDFKACAEQKYGAALLDQFLKLYPVVDGDARAAWNDAARDHSRMTTALWTEEFHKHGKSPIYGYFYTHAPPARAGGPDSVFKKKKEGEEEKKEKEEEEKPQLRIYESAVPRNVYTYSKIGPGGRFGAFHGAEIPYALNNLYAQEGYEYGETDHQVAASMSGYWANFIKTGNPNGEGLPEFQATGDGKIMTLGAENGMIDVVDVAEKQAFWREWFATQPIW
ncbi:hypothetical protein ASPZODRAFT_135279 [Penicilliopsis zonata CBS 506.65]|uniref:Carboxylic ester hydrolase n=1 Tax=Penicilliopsis zonata CBS 506.65 TaxID=1073090 RepID=A0A1L9SBA1_9EURO|nr:hypothetical protein ASPZODRAFT_135279 [Penicilliopsis zonata CBS 506.65]OJJ44455.1 hypothetical protein ASPZODRAFT_135279 [Penicilliopsis zonata CBS 506.65]